MRLYQLLGRVVHPSSFQSGSGGAGWELQSSFVYCADEAIDFGQYWIRWEEVGEGIGDATDDECLDETEPIYFLQPMFFGGNAAKESDGLGNMWREALGVLCVGAVTVYD